jgi:hypothetical protein
MYAYGIRPCMDSSNLMQSISCIEEPWKKLPMIDKVYQNGSSVVWDDRLKIHGKLP